VPAKSSVLPDYWALSLRQEKQLYVILVYDIEVKRVTKVLKTCRRYLNWVQNSVFEGEISRAKLQALKLALKRIIQQEEDSILIYRLRDEHALQKEVMGVEKNSPDSFL